MVHEGDAAHLHVTTAFNSH